MSIKIVGNFKDENFRSKFWDEIKDSANYLPNLVRKKISTYRKSGTIINPTPDVINTIIFRCGFSKNR